jgi:hypothetical protein
MILIASRTVFSRTAMILAAVACAAGGAFAQQSSHAPSESISVPTLFASASTHPTDLASVAGVNYSSSISDGWSSSLPATVDEERLNLAVGSSMQPPPRRYGRPRYNDKGHNSDGSSKYGFEAAAGFPLPVSDTHSYYNTSWAFAVGGGRNFNKNFGVNLLFDYEHLGVNGQTISNQNALYGGVPGLDANAHIWSFSLNPTYNFVTGDKYGAYVVGGVGFYHKVTNFTAPQQGQYYDPYYGYISYVANSNIDHYTSNAPGFSGGFGLTYKASRFASERFFVEARYVYVSNQQKMGLTVANSTQAPYGTVMSPGGTYTGTNYFPANSNHTTFIPIKVGVRF